MTIRRFTRLLAGAALVVAATTACGGSSGEPSPDPSPSSPTGEATLAPSETTPASAPDEPLPASWRTCDNPSAGFSIGYPGDWHTAPDSNDCFQFHPEPFTIPADSAVPPVLALFAAPAPQGVEVHRALATDPKEFTVVRDEAVTVLGQPGVRFETVANGEGLDEAGVRRYGYIFENPDPSAFDFIVWTTARPGEARYDEWKSVVDIAVGNFRFLP